MVKTFCLILTLLGFASLAAAQNTPSTVIFQKSFVSDQQVSPVASQVSGYAVVDRQTTLTIPAIDLPLTNAELVLSCRSHFAAGQAFGIGYVYISTDAGTTWQLLSAVDGNSAWQTADAGLSAYVGHQIQLRFVAQPIAGGEVVPWIIDEIRVTEQQPTPVATAGAALSATMRSLDAKLFPYLFMNIAVDTGGVGLGTLEKGNFVVRENGVTQTEAFEVTPPGSSGGARLADIIFIMDNSGSMSSSQAAIRDNVKAFVDSLVASGVDFALGLCRYGQSASGGNPLIEDNGQLTSNADYFKNTVWGRNTIDGGFEPGYYAITQSAKGFNFRAGAQKIFIIITDETADQGFVTRDSSINVCQQNSISVYSLIQQGYINNNSDLAYVSSQTNGKSFNITNPFTAILNDIQGAVSNTYVVRYRSSDPQLDGVERQVEVIVTYNTQKDTASGSYTPGASPVIQRDSATVALADQSWQPGTQFVIDVMITDAAPPFTQSATLFYRHATTTTYGSVSMKRAGLGKRVAAAGATTPDTSYWSGSIPAAAVEDPGVDYYLTATDGNNTTSDPLINPAAFPYQIGILPNVAPSIQHSVPSTILVGSQLAITATISDNTNHIAAATLYYRKTGDILYQSVAMTNTSGNSYEATIPGAFVTAAGLEYYIYAVDDFGVATSRYYLAKVITTALTLLTPNGGENWEVGSKHDIKWQATGVSNVMLEYSMSGGQNWQTIVESVAAAAGTYAWTIPNAPSKNCKVRITDVDAAQVVDVSDAAFTIFNPGQYPNWTVYHQGNSGLPENFIRAIAVDGAVRWLVTKKSGLVKFDGSTWVVFTQSNSGLPSNSILAVVVDHAHNVWVGTNGNGLAKYDGRNWTVYTTANSSLPNDRVWALAVDATGEICIGTSGGFASFNGQRWLIYNSTNSGLPDNSVYAILIDRLGFKWIGTAQGVARFDGSQWLVYNAVNSGLLENAVQCLAVDAQNNIWIGTSKGVNRFDRTNWSAFTTANSGLPENTIRSIQIDNNNVRWIGTWGGGLAKFSGNQWAVFNINNSALLDNYLLALVIDPSGYKWIGSENGGVASYQGDPGMPVAVEEPPVGNTPPESFSLTQNYPNPFNPTTLIRFSLPTSGLVTLKVYDVVGREVATLVNGPKAAGAYTVEFAGHGLPTGIYLYQLQAGTVTLTRKMLLQK